MLRELCWSEGEADGQWYEGGLSKGPAEKDRSPVVLKEGTKVTACVNDVTNQVKVFVVRASETAPSLLFVPPARISGEN